jgi:hypothetical protein
MEDRDVAPWLNRVVRWADHALKGGYCSVKVRGNESETPAVRMPLRDAGGINEFQDGIT